MCACARFFLALGFYVVEIFYIAYTCRVSVEELVEGFFCIF